MEISILNMHEHTEQEVFDFVVNHLLTQGVKSFDTYGNCLYLSPEGARCAAGCLIPAEAYDKTIEGTAWIALAQSGRVPSWQMILMERLQDCHDGYEPEKWSERLREIAVELGLQFNYNASETR